MTALFGSTREFLFSQRFPFWRRMHKIQFCRTELKAESVLDMWFRPITSPDTIIDSMEIYPSITTFVVERSRNLNYLCPFLLTQKPPSIIDARAPLASPNSPKRSRNNKEAAVTFLCRIKFVCRPRVPLRYANRPDPLLIVPIVSISIKLLFSTKARPITFEFASITHCSASLTRGVR